MKRLFDIPARVAERAATRYVVDAAGCHISTYSVASHGYAQIGWQEGSRMFGTTAHRAAWVYTHGQIPGALTVDHLCHVRRCVNPLHLRLLPNVVNAADNGQVRTNPTTDRLCHRGHPLAFSLKLGYAYCRTCRNERNRVYRRRRAAA